MIGMKAENIVFLWPLARVGGPLGMTLEWLGAANGNQMPGLWCPAALPGLDVTERGFVPGVTPGADCLRSCGA